MLQIIETLLKSFAEILVELVKLLFDMGKQGSLSFFNKRDRPLDARFHSPNLILKRNGAGFCMNGQRSLSLQDSFKNAMIIGGSGVGKSTTSCIPTLLLLNGPSVLNHDPSGEQYKTCAGILYERGYQIKVFNPANPLISDGYNPLHRVNSLSEAAPIAQTLVNASLGKNIGGDSFWNHAAESLIASMIAIVLTQPAEYRNLANVARLVNILASDAPKVDQLFSKYASRDLFEEYKSFVAQPEKLQGNILATAKTALQLFTHDSVARVTSFDTIDFDALRKDKAAVFIQNSVMAVDFYAPLTSIFFQQLFEYLLGDLPKTEDNNVLCLIDEASSFRANWQLVLANCRKYRVACLLSLQERMQLEDMYGVYAAQTIESNCHTRLYYTNQSLKSARELSELLGKYQHEDEKGRMVVRPLMDPHQIKTMPIDSAILLAGHHPPMMTTLYPYYKGKLRKYANLPLPPRQPLFPSTTVPMLPL